MPEDDGPGYSDLSAPKRQPRNGKSAHIVEGSPESGCNVRTQDPENFDEEVKSLVTACCLFLSELLSPSLGNIPKLPLLYKQPLFSFIILFFTGITIVLSLETALFLYEFSLLWTFIILSILHFSFL